MSAIQDRIHTCLKTREIAAHCVDNVLAGQKDISELDFQQALQSQLQKYPDLHEKGWYEPPPLGIAALFGESPNYERLLFDNLRKQQFWPSSEYLFSAGSVGIIYLSPVDKSGIIGDFGLTAYRGDDLDVRQHIKKCYEVIKRGAGYAAEGMTFKELHEYAQKLFSELHLTNDRTAVYTDKKSSTGLGHIVPWTHEEITTAEQAVLEGRDFNAIKDLVSKKRIFINPVETFAIPATVAFTFEARLESLDNNNLPNVFFHLVVSFVDGQKTIHGNFESIFKTLGMDYMS